MQIPTINDLSKPRTAIDPRSRDPVHDAAYMSSVRRTSVVGSGMVRKRMMDFLARRPHTEKELREKLERLEIYSGPEIEEALEFAKGKGWLPSSPEQLLALASDIAEDLRQRGKGTHFINEHLEKVGLPSVASPDDVELEKAQELVKNKYSKLEALSEEDQEKAKAKMGRFLVSRGFDLEIVRKVIYEKS